MPTKKKKGGADPRYLEWKRRQLNRPTKFARRRPKRSCLLRKSPHMRRFHLRNPWTRPLMVFNYAAVLIQKVFRAYLSRLRQGRPGQEGPVARRRAAKPRTVASNHQLDRYLAKLDYYKVTGKVRPEWLDGGFSSWCAVRIQSYWRMCRCWRREVRRKMMMYQIAALTIQNMWRYFWFTKLRPVVPTVTIKMKAAHDRASAALTIQRKWRSFCARRIFRYFSDLIRFKLKGAPGDLLRHIVPSEADLLDKAAGVHVRFRLGGTVFPPNVYFKIYTHRPLCDVNAFAPRDYSKEKVDVLVDPKYRFEKSPPPRKRGPQRRDEGKQNIRVGARYIGTKVTTTVGIDQWYKRDENNPWRPIASQVMSDYLAPPWLKDEVARTRRTQPFHFSRLRRQADIDKEKMRRKREWMMKAYTLAKEATENKDGDDEDDYGGARYRDAKYGDGDAGGDRWARPGPGNNQYEGPAAAAAEYKEAKGVHGPTTGDKGSYHDARRYDQHQHHHDAPRAEAKDGKTTRHATFVLPDDEPKRVEMDDAQLLKWTMTLDYDDYVRDWNTVATSMPSDADRKKLYSVAAGLDLGAY